MVTRPHLWRTRIVYCVPALVLGCVVAWIVGQSIPVSLASIPGPSSIESLRLYSLMIVAIGLSYWTLNLARFPLSVRSAGVALLTGLIEFCVVFAAVCIPLVATSSYAARLAAVVSDEVFLQESTIAKANEYWICGNLPNDIEALPILQATLASGSFYESYCPIEGCTGQDDCVQYLDSKNGVPLGDILHARLLTIEIAKVATGKIQAMDASQVGALALNSPFQPLSLGLGVMVSLAVHFLTTRATRPAHIPLRDIVARIVNPWPRFSWAGPLAEKQAANMPIVWASRALGLSLLALALSTTSILSIQVARGLGSTGETGGGTATIFYLSILGALVGSLIMVRAQGQHKVDLHSKFAELRWLSLCLLPMFLGVLPILFMWGIAPKPDAELGVWSTEAGNWVTAALVVETWACFVVLCGYAFRFEGRYLTVAVIILSLVGGYGLTFFGSPLGLQVTTIPFIGGLYWGVPLLIALALKFSQRAPKLYRVMQVAALVNTPLIVVICVVWVQVKVNIGGNDYTVVLAATLAVAAVALLVALLTSATNSIGWEAPER
jgi:hypothetical protein